jgi:hypothetical protein
METDKIPDLKWCEKSKNAFTVKESILRDLQHFPPEIGEKSKNIAYGISRPRHKINTLKTIMAAHLLVKCDLLRKGYNKTIVFWIPSVVVIIMAVEW